MANARRNSPLKAKFAFFYSFFNLINLGTQRGARVAQTSRKRKSSTYAALQRSMRPNQATQSVARSSAAASKDQCDQIKQLKASLAQAQQRSDDQSLRLERLQIRLSQKCDEATDREQLAQQRSKDQCDQIKQLEASLAQAHSQIGVYEKQKSDCVCGFLVFLFSICIFCTIFRYFLAILF